MKKPENSAPKIEKKAATDPFAEFKQDQFAIPADIQEELDKQGLVGRWVNINLIKRMGGRHPKGWQPYKLVKTRENIELFGSGPSDYFQRGDTVLAVKTKEKVDLHKKFLRAEAKSHSVKELMKRKGKEFRDAIRQEGLQDSVKVVEGYDEN